MSVLMPVPLHLDDCSFVGGGGGRSLKSGRMSPSALFFLKTILAVQHPLKFPMSSSTKECHQDLPRNCTESVDLLGSTVILTVLSLSIRGHRTSPSSSLRSVSPCLRCRGHRLRGLLAALPRATPHVLLHFRQTVDPVSTGGRDRGGEAQVGGMLPKTGGAGALRGAAQGRGGSQCPPAGARAWL